MLGDVFSSLPNLHPAVVHFPIALLMTAVLFDLTALLARRRWLEHGAMTLLALGTVALGAAWLSGNSASEEMWSMPGAAQAALADHQDLGVLTLLVFLVVLALRGTSAFLSRHDEVATIRVLRLFAVTGAVAGLLLLAVTADRGGALVYTHGMGVEPSARSVESSD